MNKMKIEIWSDIICPFCYIGKRKLEQAMENLPYKNEIEIEWKSFQLSPDTITDPQQDVFENFSKKKGVSVEQAKQMFAQVTAMAATVGLNFKYEIAKVANTFKAHETIHFAQQFGKQNEVKELLLDGYFHQGKNVDDLEYLTDVIKQVGLDTDAYHKAIDSKQFVNPVLKDIQEAQSLNINGVPFFVLDRKYAISGAQDNSVFTQSIEKAYTEWKKNNPDKLFETTQGPACGPDGCF